MPIMGRNQQIIEYKLISEFTPKEKSKKIRISRVFEHFNFFLVLLFSMSRLSPFFVLISGKSSLLKLMQKYILN